MTTARWMVYLILVLINCIGALESFAQPSQNINDQTKLIRIKKIATEWEGAVLTLHTRNEEKIHGRLLTVSEGNFHLAVGANQVKVPLEDVIMVSFEPGLPELFLSIASSVMGAWILGGAMVVVKDDAGSTEVGVAALLGFLGGGFWGYSTFYESDIIKLE